MRGTKAAQRQRPAPDPGKPSSPAPTATDHHTTQARQPQLLKLTAMRLLYLAIRVEEGQNGGVCETEL